MPKLTTRRARALSAMRKTHGGGRKRKPTRCAKCGAPCESARKAQAHC